MEPRRRRTTAPLDPAKVARARKRYDSFDSEQGPYEILNEFTMRLRRNEPAKALIVIVAGSDFLSGPQLIAALFSAVADDHASAVEALLRAGASPHASNGFGHRVLALAAAAGALESMEILLAAGADPNAGVDPAAPHAWDYLVPAHPLLAAASHGQSHAVELLPKRGAALDLVDEDGRSAASAARAQQEDDLADRIEYLIASRVRDELSRQTLTGRTGLGPARI